MFRKFQLPAFGLIAALLMTACQSKPPTCGDESTQTELRKVMIEQIENEARKLPFGDRIANQPEFQGFLNGITLTLSEITSDGYNSDMKKYTCQARVTASASSIPKQISDRITYNTQASEDPGPPNWIVQLNDKSPFVSTLAQVALNATSITGNLGEQSSLPYVERLYLAQQAAKNPIDSASMPTRYGTLSVNEENKLLFNGKMTEPVVEGNNSLSFLDKKSFADQDIVLVQNTGGTACPAVYIFVQLTQAGATVTKTFGTCSDLYQLEQQGSKLTMTFAGFLGPAESEQEKRAAAQKRVVYVLENGVLSKDGKPM
ncbi:hypothetical protein [Undibacterium crateris]|uniref:hypothetical protein n=1 Tax=Undibacterium crateris TaxID=2528175 RepID=UPI0013895C34|nr:hypothetical protein [Undibacterium crateris]NDI87612.1 hypothetical protein [Undibacterium crateris]